jgi:hypothetical protein
MAPHYPATHGEGKATRRGEMPSEGNARTWPASAELRKAAPIRAMAGNRGRPRCFAPQRPGVGCVGALRDGMEAREAALLRTANGSARARHGRSRERHGTGGGSDGTAVRGQGLELRSFAWQGNGTARR